MSVDVIPGTPLQEWFMDNRAKDEMIYKGAAENQIMFVRDRVHPIFVRDYDRRKENPVRVVSTHTSKSVKLPVYMIEIPKLRVIMRGNFHNWMVSVESRSVVAAPGVVINRPIISLPTKYDLFDRDQVISKVYCEGFNDEWVFGSYNENGSRFTVELGYSREALWAFLWIVACEMGVK